MGNSVQDGNVGLAFGLVIAAGLSTTLGSALVFFTDLASRRFLAMALAASAGVMIYISFAEIFTVKAVEAFEDSYLDDNDEISEDDENRASRYATFSFFGGILVTALLEALVRMIDKKNSHDLPSAEEVDEMVAALDHNKEHHDTPSAHPSKYTQMATSSREYSVTATPTESPPKELQQQIEDQEYEAYVEQDAAAKENKPDVEEYNPNPVSTATAAAAASTSTTTTTTTTTTKEITIVQKTSVADDKIGTEQTIKKVATDAHLEKMGIMTAVAIAIHNFPEGLATYVATLEDRNLGISVAIAIALHNIPEGVCVSLPIYYATGKKWKGFLVSFFSGLTEPLGALIGYAVLGSDLSDTAYGLVFGLVAGMMVYISIKELLPNALRYDPDDNVVSSSVVIGMAVMAASLLLFAV